MRDNTKKVSRVINAWQTLAPTKTFGGMTLDEFKTKTKPSFDLRDELAGLESQIIDTETRIVDADVTSNDATLLAVNAVKGDPEHGEDSALYAAMGYIRKSDRQSGLTRKAQGETTPPDESAAAVTK